MARSKHNPIISLSDVAPSMDGFEVIGVFNAGVARIRDEIILLLRVAERPVNTNKDIEFTAVYDFSQQRTVLKEFSRSNPDHDFSDIRLIGTPEGTYLTSISHLRVARSRDGVNFTIDSTPALAPANEYETFGLEDPRITRISDTYYITYVAVSPCGVVTAMASTTDFKTFERRGTIFCPDNKDVVIFPEPVGGAYYALHRPASSLFARQDMWIAESPDLICWGDHRCLMSTRPGLWDGLKIGAGAAPFRLDDGWLEIYHGADTSNRYCLGAALLDAEKPWIVKARSPSPIFEPHESYECDGFFGNVVFTCGALCENETVRLYYGAADTSICYAELPLADILGTLLP